MGELKNNKKLLIAISAYVALFLMLIWISNAEAFRLWTSELLRIFRPVLIGLILAYLCNPFFRFFERKLFYSIQPHALRRGISLFFTYLVLLLILALLLLLIVPQLINSVMDFVADSGKYVDTALGEMNRLIEQVNATMGEPDSPIIPPLDPEKIKGDVANFFKELKLDHETLSGFLNLGTLSAVIAYAEGLFGVVTDVAIGFFISLYLLNTKEKRYAQIMRFRRAFLSDRVNNVITRICSTADRSFGGFLRGKILDSTIIGVLVYLSISMLGVPYAVLIAVIVGITDIVPIIGPFIGVIPSAVIILLTDPGKVIPFLICILIIQQIDGNIIAPKILGENTGVSSLCVMIAITTMGTLWGLVGMIIGVPLFATVLELTGEVLEARLKEKGRSTETDDYYTPELAGEPEPPQPMPVAPRKRRKSSDSPLTGGTGDLAPEEREALSDFLPSEE